VYALGQKITYVFIGCFLILEEHKCVSRHVICM
jgi:hypothetical protein